MIAIYILASVVAFCFFLLICNGKQSKSNPYFDALYNNIPHLIEQHKNAGILSTNLPDKRPSFNVWGRYIKLQNHKILYKK